MDTLRDCELWLGPNEIGWMLLQIADARKGIEENMSGKLAQPVPGSNAAKIIEAWLQSPDAAGIAEKLGVTDALVYATINTWRERGMELPMSALQQKRRAARMAKSGAATQAKISEGAKAVEKMNAEYQASMVQELPKPIADIFKGAANFPESAKQEREVREFEHGQAARRERARILGFMQEQLVELAADIPTDAAASRVGELRGVAALIKKVQALA